MTWIFVAFLEPVLYAFANILDSNLINRWFKNAWALTLILTIASALFAPLVWFISPPHLPPAYLWPALLAVGLIELFYAYPYYKALASDETSVTVSLFAVGRVLIPILAFFWLGETLKFSQYAGFLLVIICSASLTYNAKEALRVNKSFFYMLLSSSLYAVQVVIYKYIFDQVSWGTGYIWTIGISGVMALLLFLSILKRKDTKSDSLELKKHYRLILFIGALGFVGSIGTVYPISVVPATVARSIGSFQPFFVLLYAILFKRFFPLIFKEQTDFGSIAKKVLLFIATIVGVIMTIK
jgi:drug/metabolite transporter (DMT)-like permease